MKRFRKKSTRINEVSCFDIYIWLKFVFYNLPKENRSPKSYDTLCQQYHHHSMRNPTYVFKFISQQQIQSEQADKDRKTRCTKYVDFHENCIQIMRHSQVVTDPEQCDWRHAWNRSLVDLIRASSHNNNQTIQTVANYFLFLCDPSPEDCTLLTHAKGPRQR